jgi:hypothetical protein
MIYLGQYNIYKLRFEPRIRKTWIKNVSISYCVKRSISTFCVFLSYCLLWIQTEKERQKKWERCHRCRCSNSWLQVWGFWRKIRHKLYIYQPNKLQVIFNNDFSQITYIKSKNKLNVVNNRLLQIIYIKVKQDQGLFQYQFVTDTLNIHKSLTISWYCNVFMVLATSEHQIWRARVLEKPFGLLIRFITTSLVVTTISFTMCALHFRVDSLSWLVLWLLAS